MLKYWRGLENLDWYDYHIVTTRKAALILGFEGHQKLFEPPHGKTNNLHRRKQRHRSASR